MISVYFFLIPQEFSVESLRTVFPLDDERFKKKSSVPQMKFFSSLLGEAIAKTVAAKRLKSTPVEILIERTPSGKPYFKDFPELHFNISHSNNAVTVAFSEFPIGIDIEKLSAPNFKVAKKFFCPDENLYIKSSASPDYTFYEIWTAKEAYFKWLGSGIDASFSKTSVLKENIKNSVHTFKKYDFLISICGEIPTDFILNHITEDFFN